MLGDNDMKINKKTSIRRVAVVAAFACGIAGMAGCGSAGVFSSKIGESGGSSKKVNYDGNVITSDVLDKTSKIENIIDNYYYYDTDDETLQDGLYKGMVEALDDPYAEYYTKEEYAKLQEDDSGEYAGIGVTVSKDEDTGYVRAVNILEGAPAEKLIYSLMI